MRAYELGVVEYSFKGNTYAPLNGSEMAGEKFSTILYDKFSGYTLKVRVDGTSKTLDMKSGRARLFIDSADWWGGQSGGPIKTYQEGGSLANRTIDVILDDMSLDEYLYQYGTAIVVVDDTDQNHLVYFTPNTRVDSKTLSAVDYEGPTADSGKSIATDEKITFNGKDTSVYALAGIVINGYEALRAGAGAAADRDATMEAVMPYAFGDVTLVDDNTTTSGYDKIFVTAYDVAKVVATSTSNGQTTVSLGTVKGYNDGVRSIVISNEKVEKGETNLTVKDADGNAIDITNIKKDDIIAFAVEPGSAGKVSDPKEIDIIVTDEKVTGKVTASDPTDKTFTIDGTAYEMTKWDESIMTIPNTYTVVLDPFGRIFDADVEKTTAKYAIAEDWTRADGLQLVLPNGSYKWYDLASGVTITIGGVAKTAADLSTYITANATAPTKRIVKYYLKASTGEIASVEVVGGAPSALTEYNGRTEKLGYTIVDSTSVINAQDYILKGAAARPSDYSVFPVSSFVDRGKYQYFAIAMEGTTNADFIVLTHASEDITIDSRFAVVKKAPSATQTADGDDCWSVTVLYDGVEQDFYFERLADNKPALDVGDAFYFVKNADGVIENGKYSKVFTKPDSSVKIYNAAPFAAINAARTSYEADRWGFNLDREDNDHDLQLVYGVVSNVKGNSTIEFAVVENVDADNQIIDRNATYEYDFTLNAIDSYGTKTFGISNDCVAYRIVLSDASGKRASEALSVTSPTGFTPSGLDDRYEVAGATAPDSRTKQKGTKVYNLEVDNADPSYDTGYNNLTYALAMVVDDQIVEIYAIEQ
jgi:hypothetical protein